ncbi:GNAT family N-acetyltransferase [Xenorhabdus taiwanensis]|uniref:GNAT family N-acetyltransferase n=1 Tax=Xenorhabdus taiwanensis TaxID=3085177 RepID=A0ABM8K4Q1_9GAMM|nr:GNAT family N-acetyltransferase [Xenorhabdus sp. TCT-1]
MGLNIRPVRPEDLTRLVVLCAEHAEYEKLSYCDNGQQQRLQTALFSQPTRLFIWVVADDSGDLHGYLSATIDYSTWSAAPFVYMDCLYLTADLRRQGIGRQLMNTLIDFAKQQQCAEIQWQTPPDNQLGVGFYQHIGAASLTKIRFTLRQGNRLW